MTKKNTWIIIIFLLFLASLSLYLYKNSLPGILRENGFKLEHVIYQEGYSLDSNNLTKIMLLVKNDRVKILGLTKKGLGWEENVASSDSNKNASAGMTIVKGVGSNRYSEKHVFIAMYADDFNLNDVSKTDEFYLNINKFNVANRQLLFIHAIAGRDKKEFSSQEVLNYLDL